MTFLFLTLLAGGIAVAVAVWRRSDDGSTDLEILRVEVDPPAGSVLAGGRQVVATVHYRYSKPAKPLHLWVQVDGESRSSYEPSSEPLRPGTGSTKRWVSLPGAGEVESLRIAVADFRLARRFEQCVPVRFTWQDDPEMVRLRDDGAGARVTGVRFDPPPGSTLKPGTRVDVEVDYEVSAERGVNLWVVPVTRLKGSYCPSEDDANGTGTAKRWFVIAGPGEVESVVVSMTNVAGEDVCEELVPAHYTYR